MKRLTFVGAFFSIFWIAPPTIAQNIATPQRHEPTIIALHRGQGVTLNFRPTGETIQRAWLDNPSQTTLDFDDASCATTAASQSCAASVIHLRRINPIDFPGLPNTSTTSLTVLTNSNLYSFRLTFPDSGSPSYSVLNVGPVQDAEQSPPSVLPRGNGLEGIEAVEQGLEIALSQALITTEDPLWQRAKNFLTLIREGYSVQTAAAEAGISQALIIRLTQLGQQSPTLTI